MRLQSKIRPKKEEPYWNPFSQARKIKISRTSSTVTVKKLALETSSQGRKDNIKTKKIQMGWKHFKDRDDKYVLVPLSKGGGSRFATVPQTMGKFELMKLCKETFFPNGLSPYGKEVDMLMDLTNFKDEKIERTIILNEVELPFNVANYMEAYKIKTVRLYLRTKKIFSLEEESEEENDLPAYLQVEEGTGVSERQSGTSLLIGTSEEQNKILEQQFNHECDMSYGEQCTRKTN